MTQSLPNAPPANTSPLGLDFNKLIAEGQKHSVYNILLDGQGLTYPGSAFPSLM